MHVVKRHVVPRTSGRTLHSNDRGVFLFLLFPSIYYSFCTLFFGGWTREAIWWSVVKVCTIVDEFASDAITRSWSEVSKLNRLNAVVPVRISAGKWLVLKNWWLVSLPYSSRRANFFFLISFFAKRDFHTQRPSWGVGFGVNQLDLVVLLRASAVVHICFTRWLHRVATELRGTHSGETFSASPRGLQKCCKLYTHWQTDTYRV